jgi:protein gp37
MADGTKIEWTDFTWNVVTGCTRVSEGCRHCYIDRTPPFRMARRRFDGPEMGATTGVVLHPERLDKPLRMRKPRLVFVNSLADLFHDEVPDRFIAEVFNAMGASPQHSYQILTKRHARMRSLLRRWSDHVTKGCHCPPGEGGCSAPVDVQHGTWPLPNVWLGVSVESQQWADIRIPALLDTPAAVRWISAEPLLGPIDLFGPLVPPGHRPRLTYWLDGRPGWGPEETTATGLVVQPIAVGPRLDWVVCGGESGPGARPMHPSWARTMRDQCTQAGVPFLFKQHGEWVRRADALDWVDPWTSPRVRWVAPDGSVHEHGEFDGTARCRGWAQMQRVGKKAAGRELDSRVWDQFPQAVTA